MDHRRPRRARRTLARTFTALLGLGLAVPALAAAPAQAGLLDPPILGSIQPLVSGAGSITSSVNGLSCSNLSGTVGVAVPCSDPLSATDLAAVTGLTAVPLTAVPATGWQFDHWDSCPSGAAGVCTVSTSLLTTLTSVVKPVAVFLPIPVTGSPDAPVTRLTSTPGFTGNQTTERSAGFAFTAVTKDGTPFTGATFECRLTGPDQLGQFQACTSPKTYSNLGDGIYEFTVQALTSTSRDSTGATYGWSVGAGSAPNTTLRGPVGWLLRNDASYTVGASGTAAGFSCRYDGTAKACSAGSPVVLKSIKAGTHTFTAAAADAAGHRDATPATATFTVPRNDTALAHSAGWKKQRGLGHFLNTFSSTTRKGATLSTKASGIKRVALVVGKGKGYGTVKVYLGTKLLKKVSLAATRTRSSVLVPVAAFATARRGTLKVVVATSGKKVVIEGLGIAGR